MLRSIACLVVLAWIAASAPAFAETIEVGPSDDVEASINALAPGDELVLAGGTYELTDGRFGVSVLGTEMEPIVIRAADGERPHFHRAAADQNIIDVDMMRYVTLRGIEFSGGSAGIRLSGAEFLTIEECEIHDTGDVALRANDTGVVYDSLRILRNHIHHTNNTGEGMYLGCNDNGCQFANSLIEGNHVHHTNQASVEQGDGIEIKEGSFNNVVRDNVIHDTNYPCVLTYSAAGNGLPNVIERNLLYNCGDHAIQSAADAVIRNNIILGASSDGIAMQPHQAGTPSNLVVVHNTVLDADGDGVSLQGATGSVVIANNALFTMGASALRLSGPLDQVTVSGNVVQGDVSGASSGTTDGDLAADFVAASFSGMPPIDVFPKAGGALVGAGDTEHVADDDFNGAPRAGVADVGAYAFDADGNPGWTLDDDFKSETDSGAAGSAAGGSGGMGAGATSGGGARAGTGGVGRGSGSGGASGRPGASGAGGDDTGTPSTNDAGTTRDGGSMRGKDDDGGCRVGAGHASGDAAWLVAALVALLARRRRPRLQA